MTLLTYVASGTKALIENLCGPYSLYTCEQCQDTHIDLSLLEKRIRYNLEKIKAVSSSYATKMQALEIIHFSKSTFKLPSYSSLSSIYPLKCPSGRKKRGRTEECFQTSLNILKRSSNLPVTTGTFSIASIQTSYKTKRAMLRR